MEEDFLALLLAASGLTALVSDRVYWGERPQGDALPGVTLNRISPGDDYHLGGKGGVHEARVQADVWAESYTAAIAVERAMKAATETPRPGNRAGCIQGVFVVGGRDLSERGRPDPLFHLSTDFMINFS